MSEVETSIDIAAPPEKVWEMAMDPERLTDWVTIHRRLHGHSGGQLQRGYEMEQTLHLRGVNFKVHWELVQCDHPVHAEWHGRGPARSHAETEYRLAANDDGGTHFAYRNEFRAPLGPLGAIASRALVGGLPKREADASLRRLKALVERDGR
jgi:carbon monoxide dehydrogenase subunit G